MQAVGFILGFRALDSRRTNSPTLAVRPLPLPSRRPSYATPELGRTGRRSLSSATRMRRPSPVGASWLADYSG